MKMIKATVAIVLMSLLAVSAYAQEVQGAHVMTPEEAKAATAAALGGGLLFMLFIGGLFTVLIGWYIGKGKGRGTAGILFSLFLGPIGWIILAILEPTQEVLDARAVRTAALIKAVNNREKHEE